jgi:hypothetical protein
MCSGNLSHRILNLEVSDQFHVPGALTMTKAPPVPIEHEAGRASESVWKLWRREESLA